MVDFLLTAKRDTAAEIRFFDKARVAEGSRDDSGQPREQFAITQFSAQPQQPHAVRAMSLHALVWT